LKTNKILFLFTAIFLIFFLGFSNTIYAAYTSSYNEPTILIKYGYMGTGVKWVQDMLNHNGYNLAIDGEFGNSTLTAVKNFQSKYNLSIDGIVGNATKTALKKYANTNSTSTSTNTTNSVTNASTMYTTANLNMRRGASTNYSIIATIPKGTAITIISNNSNGWSLVKYNSDYGFVSRTYLSSTKPTANSTNSSNNNQQPDKLPTFSRTSKDLMAIIKNCKAYYSNNKFYYSTAAGVRSIPADGSKPSGSYNRYYTDCSNYVSWVLYEYALANNNTNMKNYFSYQRNSATFASIGANGGNNYLSVVSQKNSTKTVNLANAKPGDILVSPGHVEFFNSYSINSNGTVTLKVYNCGSTNAIQAPGVTTSATRNINEITYILRVK